MAGLFPARLLAREIKAAGCSEPLVVASGYPEPSLVFLTGTETRLTDGAGAADFLRHGPCRFALVEARTERAFLRRAEVTGLRYGTRGRVDGVNLGGGRRVSIAIYHSEGGP